MAVSSVTIMVRRSRNVSVSSLPTTVRMRLGRLTAGISRGEPLSRTQQRYEHVFERRLARRGEQLRAAPACDDAAVAQDDDGVAQRGHFLHHMAGEQNALAGGA